LPSGRLGHEETMTGKRLALNAVMRHPSRWSSALER
jgi:hypothetical protein